MKEISKCNRPWLLQRCTVNYKCDFENKQYKVSDMLGLDYMGSAEYEFGALPTRIRKMEAKQLEIFEYNSPRNHIVKFFVLCLNEQWGEYKHYLDEIAEREEPYGILKEGVHFIKVIQGRYVIEPKNNNKDDFWIDLDNGIAISDSMQTLLYFMVALKNSVIYMNNQRALKDKSK